MGKLSDHKKTKMGQLPGDVPRQVKAATLEGKIKTKAAKTAKKEHVRKANRRARHKPIEEMNAEEFKAWVNDLLHCPKCKGKLGMADAVLGRCLWCDEPLD